MASNNRKLEVVLEGWIDDARRRNDVETVERFLHPDVVWQGLREDLVCPDRDHVLRNVRNAGGRLPDLDGIELSAEGDQVLLGVRSPDFTEMFGEVLDGEIFHLFTIRDGLIIRTDYRDGERLNWGIRDGSPGPKQEMRVGDPDGYVLMVARTDPSADASRPMPAQDHQATTP